jgi:hypothetical protein
LLPWNETSSHPKSSEIINTILGGIRFELSFEEFFSVSKQETAQKIRIKNETVLRQFPKIVL